MKNNNLRKFISKCYTEVLNEVINEDEDVEKKLSDVKKQIATNLSQNKELDSSSAKLAVDGSTDKTKKDLATDLKKQKPVT